jgi:ketosteroid isomerase-like protein
MSLEENIHIAERLLAGIGSGEDPANIAALFTEDIVFDIPGDDGALPWIGHKTGRAAVEDFIRGTRTMTEPIKFDIHDILGSLDRAVIVGTLETRIKATGKVTRSAIAIILTISGMR